MIDFNTVTTEELQAINPEVSPGTVAEVYSLTLRGSSDRPFTYYDEEYDQGIWVPVVHSNTYGTDPCSAHMIETNEKAAVEMLDAVDAHYTYDRGMLCALVCDPEGTIDEATLAVCNEIAEALESYPLLDEDAYSEACFEEVSSNMDSAIEDEARGLSEETVEALEDLDLDAENILQAALEAGDLGWHEADCWPYFEAHTVKAAIGAAILERREEHARGAAMAANCPRTLDLFEVE